MKKGSFGPIYSQSKTYLIIFKNYVFEYFFFVSSMGGVPCGTIVSERLKMRKLLGVHYRQDIISGAEVNNVINNNELLGVSTSFVILCYFSL